MAVYLNNNLIIKNLRTDTSITADVLEYQRLTNEGLQYGMNSTKRTIIHDRIMAYLANIPESGVPSNKVNDGVYKVTVEGLINSIPAKFIKVA